MIAHLATVHHLDPAAFGDLTYGQVVNLLTGGRRDELERKAWRAKKLLADLKAGVIDAGDW